MKSKFWLESNYWMARLYWKVESVTQGAQKGQSCSLRITLSNGYIFECWIADDKLHTTRIYPLKTTRPPSYEARTPFAQLEHQLVQRCAEEYFGPLVEQKWKNSGWNVPGSSRLLRKS